MLVPLILAVHHWLAPQFIMYSLRNPTGKDRLIQLVITALSYPTYPGESSKRTPKHTPQSNMLIIFGRNHQSWHYTSSSDMLVALAKR